VTPRTALNLLLVALIMPSHVFAQPSGETPTAQRFVDPVNGLSLEDAITRALGQEPSLRSARSQIEVAEGMRRQAALRPNPTASFERREEPAGSDNQTTVGVEWPLDLFRKGPRVAVADRQVAAVQSAVADRERLLQSEVRTRYGELLATIRDLMILDELVATTQRQHELLRSRVEEGATPPLERNLLDVELRRLEAERLLQTGRTEAALFELKRVLGMTSAAGLTVRETLEAVVKSESAPARVGDTATLIDGRADVREAAARLEVASAKIDQVRAEGRFDVSLFANYMRMDAGFPQRGFAADGGLERVRGVFHYLSAGAMVTVPVLNRNEGEVAAATAERTSAAAAYDAARLAADAELAAARARDERAREAVNAYTSGAQALARQNLTVVSQSYDLGRVTVFDVLAEQRRYLDVERAYTETLKAAYEARTALNRAVGGVR
jgi:cobalt-zinc-cadmium efflux system outer membrane protein